VTTSRRRFLLAGAGLFAAACAASDGAGPAGDGADGPGPGGATTPPTTAAVPEEVTPPPTTRPAGPRFVVRGPDPAPGAPARVALTFHTDGSVDLARRLVDELRRGGAVATCFLVGSWLDKNPSWAGELRSAGHELANHTYTHPDSEALSTAVLQADIARCRDVLVRLTGSPGRFFRPSGTDDGTSTPTASIMAAAAAAGYLDVAGFDVDPLDYRDPGTATVTQRTLAGARPGSILSLHFGHAGTVAALPGILGGLADRGLEPVTLSTLLG
jgi:peptidoglycan/xylan/chitin deacetylase (PgdA/CDA1 family)